MADSSDNINSWPGFLHQVNKTFLLIRDLFGYAIPGAVFLAIGVVSGRLSIAEIQRLLNWQSPSPWLAFVIALIASYVVGDVLAAIAYAPIAIRKFFQWREHKRRGWYPVNGRPHEFTSFLAENARKVDWLIDNPTEVTGDLLEIRSRHPEFFLELDRRETLLLLSASNAAAFLGGVLAFYWPGIPIWGLFLIAGLALLLQVFTGIPHLRRVRWAVREADTIAKRRDETVAGMTIESVTIESEGAQR
jgi:hypothetical protein